jgi:hypothetical protein
MTCTVASDFAPMGLAETLKRMADTAHPTSSNCKRDRLI